MMPAVPRSVLASVILEAVDMLINQALIRIGVL